MSVWYRFADKQPPEGDEDVRLVKWVKPEHSYMRREDHARFENGKWCNYNWHCDVEPQPDDLWQPVEMPPVEAHKG